ncbi:hypothetical protein WH47_07445, partial [Habropoda laboriosa]
VIENPNISPRQIAHQCNISKSSVLRILHYNKFHPYHLNIHQQISNTDFANRTEFCRWAQRKIQNNNSFLNLVLFSDEATFTNRENVNVHNIHFWAQQNPHWLRQIDHQRQ